MSLSTDLPSVTTARRLGISKGYIYKRLDGNPQAQRPGRMSVAEIASALAASSEEVDAAAAASAYLGAPCACT